MDGSENIILAKLFRLRRPEYEDIVLKTNAAILLDIGHTNG
jgi:hypothetical protein